MSECNRCDDGRFVCENHPDRPFFGERACTCDGAGEPCPDCNASEVTAPEMPDDFAEDRPVPRGVYIGKRLGGPPMNEADNSSDAKPAVVGSIVGILEASSTTRDHYRTLTGHIKSRRIDACYWLFKFTAEISYADGAHCCASSLRFPSDCVNIICGKVATVACFRKAECFSRTFPMTPKMVATFLILFAFATAGTNSTSAQDGGFRGGGFNAGGGSRLHSGGFQRRGSHGRAVGGYVFDGDYGYSGDTAYVDDWYGISPGHDECPLFRRRVMTPDGPRVQMVPNC
jgi:hypothetical protein